MTITKEQIKNFIAENPVLSSIEIATQLGVDKNVVAGLKAWHTLQLKRQPKTTELIGDQIKSLMGGTLEAVNLPTTPVEPVKKKLGWPVGSGKKTAPVEPVVKEVEKIITPTTNYGKEFQNYNGEGKGKARERISNHIIFAKVDGIFPSLPASNAIIEKQIILGLPKCRFIGVENNKATYDKLVETIKEETLPITPVFGDISTLIYGKKQNQYGGLILDYCGILPSFTQEIEHALHNNIVKVGGIIAMTFSMPIRKTEFVFNVPKSNSITDKRSKSEQIIEGYFHNLVGRYRNYEFVEIFNYRDTSPMTLIVLKRLF